MSNDRIRIDMTVPEILYTLSEGNPGALTVLMDWMQSSDIALFQVLTLDSKKLYGSRIWELYKDICGEDLDRFKYHVLTELPNQETGILSVSGTYSPDFDDSEFWERRRFGTPNSFWALEHPPVSADYEFPIK